MISSKMIPVAKCEQYPVLMVHVNDTTRPDPLVILVNAMGVKTIVSQNKESCSWLVGNTCSICISEFVRFDDKIELRNK